MPFQRRRRRRPQRWPRSRPSCSNLLSGDSNVTWIVEGRRDEGTEGRREQRGRTVESTFEECGEKCELRTTTTKITTGWLLITPVSHSHTYTRAPTQTNKYTHTHTHTTHTHTTHPWHPKAAANNVCWKADGYVRLQLFLTMTKPFKHVPRLNRLGCTKTLSNDYVLRLPGILFVIV